MWRHPHRRRRAALVLGSVLCAALLQPPPMEAHSCAAWTLLDLCELMGRQLSEQQVERIVRLCPAEGASMLDVKEAGRSVGTSLVGVAATLDELAGQVVGPKIIHLENPQHFVVMGRASPDWVQLADCGGVRVVPRGEIESRYTGHALILEQGQQTGGPKLELGEFHYGFGIVGIGQHLEHAFRLSNAGDQDLALTMRAKRCGAPDASIGKELLGPGESTDVTVKFTVTHSGPIMKSLALLTSDLYHPVAYVTIHGKVPHDLRAYPAYLRMIGEKGQAVSRIVKISGPAEMKLMDASCEKGLFGIQVGQPNVRQDESRIWEIELTFQPEAFVGEFEDQLSIRTTHQERALITIPIAGRIRGDIEAEPRAVFFGFLEPNAEGKREVLLQSRSSKPFEVTQATCEDGRVAVATPKRLTDGRWQVLVSVQTGQEGVVDATVVVTTDVPGEERLKIPVYAHILGQE